MAEGRKASHRSTPRHFEPRQACSLEHLPAAVVSRVFDLAELKLHQVVISKQLLPFALQSLYRDMQLYSNHELRRFAASIYAQPALAAAVLDFGLSGRGDALVADSVSQSAGSRIGSARMSVVSGPGRHGVAARRGRRGKSSKPPLVGGLPLVRTDLALNHRPAPYEPGKLVPNGALLRDLLRRLTSLEHLILFGRSRLIASLDPELLADGRLTSLKSIGYTFGEKENGTLNDEHDNEVCRRLQLLPSLEHLDCFTDTSMGLDLLNLGPPCRLEPRSWALAHVTLNRMLHVGPEARHLFASLKPGLKTLKIHTMSCYGGLADDMALLPPTIEMLNLNFGRACHSYDGGPVPSFDKVLIPLFFPRLKRLSISGPLLDSWAIPSLADLPELDHLCVGYHIPLSDTILLAFLARRPPTLSHLGLNVCACPDVEHGSSSRLPRWHANFSAVEAHAVIREAEKVGVHVCGNITCALMRCDRRDGHLCLRDPRDPSVV